MSGWFLLLLAQAAGPPLALPPVSEPGSALTVTLITYESGGAVWERFGHNALWIHDAAAGTDAHFDYGRFSFQKPHFILHFLQGVMWYSMGFSDNPAGIIEFYAREGRKVWAQELDLSPAQRLALRNFLFWNIRPENAEYAYDYYRDNCSTRIRDAIDRVLGGALQRSTQWPSGMTWRDETRRLNQHNPALYSGLLLALGRPVDAEMTRWEQMFLPMRLREHLDSLRVIGPDGHVRPVVKAERVLAEGGRYPVPARPSNWTVWYLGAGLLLGGLLAGLSRTRGFMPLATAWSLLGGLLGGLMTWLWAFSHHVATYFNENLLLLNLLALALAVVLPSALRGRAWAAGPARKLAALQVALAVIALVLKVFPWPQQHNLELIALVLPVHAGIAFGVFRATLKPSLTRPAPS